jgi:hypothetical protein
MHGPISPKKVEIAGDHRNLLQLKQPRPERVAKQKLSCRVIKNDLKRYDDLTGRQFGAMTRWPALPCDGMITGRSAVTT